MKKKLFENVGNNMFRMSEDTSSNSLEDAIQNMTPEQKNDDALLFKAIEEFFKDAGTDSRAIFMARNTLKDNDVDDGLVDEYLANSAGADINPNDEDQY